RGRLQAPHGVRREDLLEERNQARVGELRLGYLLGRVRQRGQPDAGLRQALTSRNPWSIPLRSRSVSLTSNPLTQFMTNLRPQRRATWAQRWPTPDPAPSKTEGVPELAGQEPAEQAGKREQIVGHEQSTHRDQNSSGGHIDDATPAPKRPNQGDAPVDPQA